MWRTTEEKILKEFYSDKTNEELSIMLNKSKSSIDNKAYRLGLKKSLGFLKLRSEMGRMGRINKGGRNLDYNTLKNIAKKYRTKMEFIEHDEPAYQACNIKGYLKELTEHMPNFKYSKPQLILADLMNQLLDIEGSYNDRKVIKPYEIDLYYDDFKLGFEYQGLYWHNFTNNDKIKKEICENNTILLIHVHELSRNYENDIKTQIIDNLDLINLKANSNLTSLDVNNIKINNVYDKIYNKEKLLSLCKKYNSFNEFIKKHKKEYRKLLKLKIVDEATSHMKDKRVKIKLSDYDITEIVKTYNNLTDFRLEQLKLYKHIKRVNKNYLISHLNRN